MTADLPTDWLTVESVVTLAGASAAVVSITNTAWKLFRWRPLVVGIFSSVLIVAYSAYASGKLDSLGGFFIALMNICILFSMAFGIDETLITFAKGAGAKPGVEATALVAKSTAAERPWLRSWVH